MVSKCTQVLPTCYIEYMLHVGVNGHKYRAFSNKEVGLVSQSSKFVSFVHTLELCECHQQSRAIEDIGYIIDDYSSMLFFGVVLNWTLG